MTDVILLPNLQTLFKQLPIVPLKSFFKDWLSILDHFALY